MSEKLYLIKTRTNFLEAHIFDENFSKVKNRLTKVYKNVNSWISVKCIVKQKTV